MAKKMNSIDLAAVLPLTSTMHVLVYNQWNVRGNMRGSGSWCSFAYFEIFRGPLTLSLSNGPAKSPEAFGLVLPWRTSDAFGSCPFPRWLLAFSRYAQLWSTDMRLILAVGQNPMLGGEATIVKCKLFFCWVSGSSCAIVNARGNNQILLAQGGTPSITHTHSICEEDLVTPTRKLTEIWDPQVFKSPVVLGVGNLVVLCAFTIFMDGRDSNFHMKRGSHGCGS